ncbi:MAG: hypothetical protein HQK49_09195 [Oligoflexia bacterium]|nr:hypothetical protein [Oligoflexia bacterium]
MERNRTLTFFLLLLLSSLLSSLLFSCSSLETITAKVSGRVFKKASLEMETEKNFNIFKEGTPANLKMLEGLLFLYPQEMNLLQALNKSYTAYALLADETSLIEFDLTKNAKMFKDKKEDAISNYSKALTYGLRYLEIKGIALNDLVKNVNDDTKIIEMLNKNLDADDEYGDVELVFFVAQSLGGLINLQKDKPEMISMLPITKILFDWVCIKRPNFYNGGCDLFYAVYEMGRPVIMGGSPERAKNYFLKAIKENPQNLFIRTMFLQHYHIPMLDEDAFKAEIAQLENELTKFIENTKWTPFEKEKEKEKETNNKLNIYNGVAKKRFDIFKQNEKTIFN